VVSVVAIENILLAAVSVVSFALTAIAVLAYRRTHDAHLVLLAAAFGAFFVKGLAMTILLFLGSVADRSAFLLSGALDLVILALFYGFTLRR